MSVSEKIVCMDVDGVLHSYTTPYKNPTTIPDPPVKGAKEFCQQLLDKGYQVYVLSSRCSYTGGLEAVTEWLKKWGIPYTRVVRTKPPAYVSVDDRAICFKGEFSTDLMKQIDEFKTYRALNQ